MSNGLGRFAFRALAFFAARRLSGVGAIFALCFLAVPASGQTSGATSSPALAGSASPSEGNKVCQQCHAAIYRSYRQTAMAQASGPSKGNVLPGEFLHALSRVHYRVYEQDDKVWLSFDRDGPDEIHGKRELLYYIGSGHRGRTYVFAEDGFFFESPVNWYGQKSVWDMTPAYQDARHIPLNLPLSSECLSCHTNDLQAPVRGTENKYSAPILTGNGIGCARCHGSPDAHPGNSQLHRPGPILNPARLPAARRDAVCMQCHLEGSVAIRQPGRNLSDFKPGEDLQDYVHYFVLAQSGPGLPAISQFEALFQSKCKLKSGDAMSCTSCHDPHSSPGPAERAAYYRSKCLTCHGGKLAATHYANQPDCVACHMPAVASSNIAHTQATDHRILRNATPADSALPAQARPELKRFPPSDAKDSDRDLALAWQSLAEEGMGPAVTEAEKYLRRALAERPDDVTLLTAMGFVEQKRGDLRQATSIYERALANDPLATVAAADLGVIAAQAGELDRAIALWTTAFDRQPGSSAIGINLAKALCKKGKPDEAHSVLKRVLEFNPDLPEAKKLLVELNLSPSKCSPQ